MAYGNDLAVEQYPDGTVLSLWETQIEEGESVLVLLQRTGLPVETASSALGVYVSGIGGLLAGKCGSGSGWVYEVNGEQILDSCDKYALKDGDNVVWKYVT